MAEITTSMVKDLREATGAGVMDCRRALEEANGDAKKAAELLREKGIAAAAKRADREAKQGVVESYIHAQGRIGVLLELNCETDFVANTDNFRALAKNIAMQIAAMNPQVVSVEDRAGKEIEGKDEEVVLLAQPHVNGDKFDGKTIDQIRGDLSAKTGENVEVRRFVRFAVGE